MVCYEDVGGFWGGGCGRRFMDFDVVDTETDYGREF